MRVNSSGRQWGKRAMMAAELALSLDDVKEGKVKPEAVWLAIRAAQARADATATRVELTAEDVFEATRLIEWDNKAFDMAHSAIEQYRQKMRKMGAPGFAPIATEEADHAEAIQAEMPHGLNRKYRRKLAKKYGAFKR